MRDLLWIGALAAALLACEPVKSEDACTPLDTPSFSNVYDIVLVSSCAVGGSCHGGGGSAGGLDLGDELTAYDALVEGGRVTPGDAASSLLMARLESDVSHSQHMPPGQLLSAPERCMIATWINEGALP